LSQVSSVEASAQSKATLFPYATLFRSRAQDEGQQGHSDEDAQAQRGQGHGEEAQPARTVQSRQGAVPRRRHHQAPAGRLLRGGEDRKSTRLNSSHVKISYAVFCLKKKN